MFQIQKHYVKDVSYNMTGYPSFLSLNFLYYSPIHILRNVCRMFKIRQFGKSFICGNIFLLLSLYHIKFRYVAKFF